MRFDGFAARASAKQLARALYFGSSDLVRRCETMTDAEQELRAFTSVHLAEP